MARAWCWYRAGPAAACGSHSRRAWKMAWPTSMPSALAPRPARATAHSRPNWIPWPWSRVPRLRRRPVPGPRRPRCWNCTPCRCSTRPRGRVLARGGRRAVRRGCRRGRLAQGQRLARPRAAAGAPGRCADARRLPPPGTAFATVALGGRFASLEERPLASSLAFLKVPLSGRVVWPGLMEVHPMRPAPCGLPPLPSLRPCSPNAI